MYVRVCVCVCVHACDFLIVVYVGKNEKVFIIIFSPVCMGNRSSSLKVVPYKDDAIYCGHVSSKKDVLLGHGKGKYIDSKDNIYMGEFRKDSFHGKGILYYNADPSQDELHRPYSYEGDWVNNMKHGKGKMVFTNNDVYEGEFQYDEIHGMGKFTYDNGNYYIGQFSCGINQGEGTLYRSDHVRLYHGQWGFDTFNGKGVYYYTNGRKQYEGFWRNGVAHGIGVTYDKEGNVEFYGEYTNGTPYLDMKDECLSPEIKQHYMNGSPTPTIDTKIVQRDIKENLAMMPHLRTPDMKPITPMVERKKKMDEFTLGPPSTSPSDIHVKQNPLRNITKNTFMREVEPTNSGGISSYPMQRDFSDGLLNASQEGSKLPLGSKRDTVQPASSKGSKWTSIFRRGKNKTNDALKEQNIQTVKKNNPISVAMGEAFKVEPKKKVGELPQIISQSKRPVPILKKRPSVSTIVTNPAHLAMQNSKGFDSNRSIFSPTNTQRPNVDTGFGSQQKGAVACTPPLATSTDNRPPLPDKPKPKKKQTATFAVRRSIVQQNPLSALIAQ